MSKRLKEMYPDVFETIVSLLQWIGGEKKR